MRIPDDAEKIWPYAKMWRLQKVLITRVTTAARFPQRNERRVVLWREIAIVDGVCLKESLQTFGDDRE